MLSSIIERIHTLEKLQSEANQDGECLYQREQTNMLYASKYCWEMGRAFELKSELDTESIIKKWESIKETE